MAKKLKAGDIIHGYRVTKVFGPGMMAISYGAQAPGGREGLPQAVQVAGADGRLVRAVRRLPAGALGRVAERDGRAFRGAPGRCVRGTWGGRCYFQAYEFVENGADLQQMLDEERSSTARTSVAPARDPAIWARHVTWAKVFMAGIAALHESEDRACGPQARKRLPHPGPDHWRRLSSSS